MNERIERIIAKLERIPVQGITAMLMGDSLKELFLIKAELEKPAEKEGEKECQK